MKAATRTKQDIIVKRNGETIIWKREDDVSLRQINISSQCPEEIVHGVRLMETQNNIKYIRTSRW
jgi:hypothetical protein